MVIIPAIQFVIGAYLIKKLPYNDTIAQATIGKFVDINIYNDIIPIIYRRWIKRRTN